MVSKEPVNYNFWFFTVSKLKDMEQFLLRGTISQKEQIINVLTYMEKIEPIEFEAIKGRFWLGKFKDSLQQ